MPSPSKAVAATLLHLKAVTIRTNPPYTWSSGILSPIYCDNRVMLSYVEEREMIVAAYVKAIRAADLTPDVIAGTATAGIPWGALIAAKLKLPFVYVRTSAKGHGKGNQIEGAIKKGQKVVLIEDLISTGGSSLDCATALKATGAKVIAVVAIFTYELEIAKQNFKKAKIDLVTLTNFPTLVEVAVEEKYLSAQKKAVVLEWSRHPGIWHPDGSATGTASAV